MGISDLIACFIRETLEKADGVAELQRSQLAEQFHCVPSQINYVIATRFSPERGYLVESRRGEGGYIRVIRVPGDCKTLAMHAINGIGEKIDASSARAILSNLQAENALSPEYARMIRAGISPSALHAVPSDRKGQVRAGILKQMLLQALCN
ncbi:MAG: CtsR family transcriptional regulator [Oscillospiraceae bacterium]|nr:CtsR family transcriptional regulator [Oscillospiraceae bacterium]